MARAAWLALEPHGRIMVSKGHSTPPIAWMRLAFGVGARRKERAEMPEHHGKDAPTGSRRKAEEDRQAVKRHLDELLDEALKGTFPASDPIAITPPRRAASAPKRGTRYS